MSIVVKQECLKNQSTDRRERSIHSIVSKAQVFAVVSGDEDAIRCKVVALIIDDAINVFANKFSVSEGLPMSRERQYSSQSLNLYKIQQAWELGDALQQMFPSNVMPILLQVAVCVRENKAGIAEETLGHPQIASESLLTVPDIQHMSAPDVLDSTINYWLIAMTEDNKLSVITQQAAAFKVKHGQKEASKYFEKLVKSHHSIEAVVGLIQTAACIEEICQPRMKLNYLTEPTLNCEGSCMAITSSATLIKIQVLEVTSRAGLGLGPSCHFGL
ncbi:signal recognition particle subunit SRP72 [Tanacetum coccineum]